MVYTQITIPSQQKLEVETLGEPSDGYAKAFEDFGLIVHVYEAPMAGMTSHRYVKHDPASGVLTHLVYGCQGDTIVNWTESLYIRISDLSTDTQNELIDMCKDSFRQYENMNCCSVSYEYYEDDYFRTQVKVIGANSAEAMAELKAAGIVSNVSADSLSLSMTEPQYLAQGFIKR